MTVLGTLRTRRRAARARSQAITCPYCELPVAGLLSGCTEPDCRSREIAADAAFRRAVDL
ncbi:hypothetical protein [Catenuloplanes indicus]|uniref:Uncharacterized protein n=1 Tax=Catenuloplanes indicus TaxID=137267 RepID=A0AAE3WAC5_9ACTN|nr:hypothetical protein [Catenuloplanes indicus]MDQ0371549.1 hypothetical protein [Catenuloplanes indicus]